MFADPNVHPFHSFNDPERGIVWEFSLALLPDHVRTLLLSATVGNSREFVGWLKKNLNRRLELVEGDRRKVPLTFEWVPDRLLGEQIEEYVKRNYDIPARFFVQEELNGQSPAVYLCKDYVTGPAIVVFVDTIIQADLLRLKEETADVVAYVKEVQDPRRFGVAEAGPDGWVERLVEKGILTREASKEDRRRVVIRVAPELKEDVAHIEAAILQSFVDLVGRLGPATTRKWCEVLEHIETALVQET